MAKTLCEWKAKDIVQSLGKLQKHLLPPEVVCQKCARCASHKKYLCKPMKLEKSS